MCFQPAGSASTGAAWVDKVRDDAWTRSSAVKTSRTVSRTSSTFGERPASRASRGRAAPS